MRTIRELHAGTPHSRGRAGTSLSIIMRRSSSWQRRLTALGAVFVGLCSVFTSSCRDVRGTSGAQIRIHLDGALVDRGRPDHITVRIADEKDGTKFLCFVPGKEAPVVRDGVPPSLLDPCNDIDALGAKPPNPWQDTAKSPIVFNLVADGGTDIDVEASAHRGGKLVLARSARRVRAQVPFPEEEVTLTLDPSATQAIAGECAEATEPSGASGGVASCFRSGPADCIDPASTTDRISWTRAMVCECTGVCAENTPDKGVCTSTPGAAPVVWSLSVKGSLLRCRRMYAQVSVVRCIDTTLDGPIATTIDRNLATCKLTAACTVPPGTAIRILSDNSTVEQPLDCLSPRPYPSWIALPVVGADVNAISLVQPVLERAGDCRVKVDGFRFGESVAGCP